MSIPRTLVVAALFGMAATATAQEVRIAPQDSGVDVRLRGIAAVDGKVAWASGRKGTVLRTIDGGAHWQSVGVPGAEELDFRDIEAFDAMTAVVLSIGPGEASRVYRTEDGGAHWTLVLQNRDPRAFFDCMAFDGERGRMLGDPVDGHFQVYATDNGGRDWRLLEDGPAAAEGEAAFAASGTCIARVGEQYVIGTGGSVSRIHFRHDAADSWQTIDSGLGQARPTAGVFSISHQPPTWGFVAVGGDFEREREAAATGRFLPVTSHALGAVDGSGTVLATESNGFGFRQSPTAVLDTPGYRSGLACGVIGSRDHCIAVGPSGVDAWNGAAWSAVSDTGYDAIDLAGNVGWASGDAGRIARVEVTAAGASEVAD